MQAFRTAHLSEEQQVTLVGAGGLSLPACDPANNHWVIFNDDGNFAGGFFAPSEGPTAVTNGDQALVAWAAIPADAKPVIAP